MWVLARFECDPDWPAVICTLESTVQRCNVVLASNPRFARPSRTTKGRQFVTNAMQRSGWISKVVARGAKAAPMLILAFASATAQLAPIQTYKTVHRFSGGQDGAEPLATVILDNAGNLYGTTSQGGNLKCFAPNGCGTIFKI